MNIRKFILIGSYHECMICLTIYIKMFRGVRSFQCNGYAGTRQKKGYGGS